MSLISRVKCPTCGAECFEQESRCWQCGKPLRISTSAPPMPEEPARDEVIPAETAAPAPSPSPLFRRFTRKSREPEKKPVALDDVLKLDDLYTSGPEKAEPASAESEEPTQESDTPVIRRTTLTGEVVEVPESSGAEPAATIGNTAIESQPEAPIYVQTYCSNCGYQNMEGVRECKKCGSKLAILQDPPGEIEPLPRNWGFDVLGGAWIILGLSAIYSGIFLIQADQRTGTTLGDYFWTLIVAAAPGILIFMRHVFCKLLFWVMSFVSLFIWLVIGFIWLYVGLRLSINAEVGLTWFAVFSALSLLSWFTVRVNDEFDVSL